MRLSRYFLPLLKENPKEAEIVSHRLMLRAGMICQEAAGIYSWLPLGLRVLSRIAQIIREEMDRAGGHEILMPTIQPAGLWRESGRYGDYGRELLRMRDRHERDMLYGPTNEEMVTGIFRRFVRSYRQLPLNLYHIQWKFRDELRPRFGVMRGREFLMKDAYSFDTSPEAARISYNRMFVAQLRCFYRMGLRAVPLRAQTGPIGGDLSHEFAVLAKTGESEVYCHRDLLSLPVPGLDALSGQELSQWVARWTAPYAASDEMHDPARFAQIDPDAQLVARGVEVGHIFYFATKYSRAMQAFIQGESGGQADVYMGSYGIGVSRLAGAIIEACHDEKGIVWPAPVAPFDCGLINIKTSDAPATALCDSAHTCLKNAGLSVLYDDSDERAGAKFAAMDLIGLPLQIIIGPRDAAQNTVEVKQRHDGMRQKVTLDALPGFILSAHRALMDRPGAAGLAGEASGPAASI